MAAYRPPGRSGRSGRSQADNDIFEGLPVKQWSTVASRVSLAPPPSETDMEKALDKWADPAMPESSHLLLPHTQQLLRIARSGKYGTKRKTAPDVEPDGDDFNAREEEGVPDETLTKPTHIEEKGFIARKWRQVPESSLVPEHLHWEFLAKRRKGLPNFYHGVTAEVSTSGMPQIARRKTRVQKVVDAATGASVIYEVLALEGQVLENELPAESRMQAVQLEPGTTIEGLGTAGEDGVISLVPSGTSAPSRRNRPPPKKKGGPGRGKKRVTFTNPDGSTYTTIVPNATKIVPQPGQTVKHVAKGEDPGKDVSMEEAARLTHGAEDGGEHDDDGDDDEDGDDGDDDDEDREEGEIPEDDVEAVVTTAKKAAPVVAASSVETRPAKSVPTALASSSNTPLGAEEPRAQLPMDENKLDVDVEMLDRPANSETTDSHVPEPVVQSESLPESLSGRDDTLSKSELRQENTHVIDDIMEIGPSETIVMAQNVTSPTASTQPTIIETEPATQVEVGQPGPVLESERALERAGATSQSPEQVLEVEVELPTEVPVNSGAEKDAEAPTQSKAVLQTQEAVMTQETDQVQEPPLKTFEDGEEDLLGSLERSLES